MTETSLCQHIKAITNVNAGDSYVCEACIKQNSKWLHLRTCQSCGATLCCDDSPNKHMTKHYHESHHPVVASAEPGERWLWCYPDEQFVQY